LTNFKHIANVPDISRKLDKIKNTNPAVSIFTFMEVVVFHGISVVCEKIECNETLKKQVMELADLQFG
jgi:hypothetical protein